MDADALTLEARRQRTSWWGEHQHMWSLGGDAHVQGVPSATDGVRAPAHTHLSRRASSAPRGVEDVVRHMFHACDL